MATYYVYKRIINDYRVKVNADSPEAAIREAAAGCHEPGELSSKYNDGDDFYPSGWIVEDGSGSPVAVSSREITK